ncbi:MAG: helix-turn-helix domain-containing protein [Clostridiales bacterium]|nr:helix-turn-helix domain-containing protein [Clostridiales bacterium]
MMTGDKIAAARKAKHLTQEALAQKLGVSFQAVSGWERGESIPDIPHLQLLSRELDVSIDRLLSQDEHPWQMREKLFDEERMYTYLKAKAQSLGLSQTLAALPFARACHQGQFRKGGKAVPYIIHPLTMACHAFAMGLADDDVLAALLLHDVIEDTDTRPDELPVSSRVREAVCLVSYDTYPGPKAEIKRTYYDHIAENPLACLIKCVDRCNNLSGMAYGFARSRMAEYVVETEKEILPLLDVIKSVPEWNHAAWLLRYQIASLLETFKRFL